MHNSNRFKRQIVRTTSTALTVFSLTISLYSQQGIVTTGGDATGSFGSVSYSFGQVDYITATGSSGTITQGLQQPYEIYQSTGVHESTINLVLHLYPNPTTDMVQLVVENSPYTDLNYSLFDALGKLIEAQSINSGQTTILVEQLASGTYFLKVMSGINEIKTYKIIKK